jgi:hypothetical protein
MFPKCTVPRPEPLAVSGLQGEEVEITPEMIEAGVDGIGAPEIEVTPAMIEAGVSVLYASGSIENPLGYSDRQLVQKVFRAMARHSK